MKSIYCYSTDTYAEKNWHKVGETSRYAQDRIAEQDTTSTAERIDLPHNQHVWSVPEWMTDHKIHAELQRMGHHFLRDDKKREWFEFDGPKERKHCWAAVSTAINNLVHGVARPNSYPPREEQQACVDKACEYFRNGGSEFLMNAKMRYGKTFASYLIAKEMGYKNILIVTYKPAVKAGWREDLESHVYFDGWHYSQDNGFVIDQSAKANVIFASFQDINDFDKKEKWQGITDHHFDLVVIDEMHYGSSTQRARLTLDSLTFDHTLFVSGTPLKALCSGRFLDENKYDWSYQEEQRKRAAEKKGRWKTDIYRWLPPMNIHTFDVCDEAKKNALAYSEEEGFSMTKMFGATERGFEDPATVKLFFDQIFGRGVHKSQSPFRTCAADHSLWVMPVSVHAVNATCELLEILVGAEYKIINVAGDNISCLTKVKNLIRQHDKTITVTCGRFNTGTTVPEWNAVLMLNDTKSPETYFQTIFRVQSPNKKARKEICYVFDFNPERTLEMVYEQAFIQASKTKSITQNVREFMEFAPIIDHSGNALKEIDPESVISFMSESANYVDKFTSSYLFDDSKCLEFGGLLQLEGGVKDSAIKRVIAENDLTPGKNYINLSKRGKAAQNLEAKLKKEIISKAKALTKLIPEYVTLVHPAENVNAMLHGSQADFEEHFGIEQSFFEELIEKGFINHDRLNRLISSLTPAHISRAIEYARDEMHLTEEANIDIISRLQTKKDDAILVVQSYEMLPVLHKLGYSNLTLAYDNPRKSIQKIAKKYTGKDVIDFNDTNNMKKFDTILMNPPYQGRAELHQKFFNNAVDMVKDGGTVCSIQPATPYHSKKPSQKNTKIMKQHLKDYTTEVVFKGAEIFAGAAVATDLAITYLTKTPDKEEISKVTYVDGKVYRNIPIENISKTGMNPHIYANIRDKILVLVNRNGSLSDIETHNPNEYKADFSITRGNPGTDDIYTFLSKDLKYHYNPKASFGIKAKNKKEVDNIYSYLRTNAARVALSLLKDNITLSRKQMAYVPQVPFDREWTDAELYPMFKFTPEEIAEIERVIPPYYDK